MSYSRRHLLFPFSIGSNQSLGERPQNIPLNILRLLKLHHQSIHLLHYQYYQLNFVQLGDLYSLTLITCLFVFIYDHQIHHPSHLLHGQTPCNYFISNKVESLDDSDDELQDIKVFFLRFFIFIWRSPLEGDGGGKCNIYYIPSPPHFFLSNSCVLKIVQSTKLL